MKINPIGHLVKANPIKPNLSQLKPISNPNKPNLSQFQCQSNPIKPNLGTTLIGISQAGAQDGMGDLRLTIANPDSSLR